MFNYRHRLRTHYEGKLHECKCGSVFRHNFELKDHQDRNNQKLPCEVCAKLFTHKSNLSKHWKKIHFPTHGPLRNSKSELLKLDFVEASMYLIITFNSKGFEQKRTFHLRLLWKKVLGSWTVPRAHQNSSLFKVQMWFVPSIFRLEKRSKNTHYERPSQNAVIWMRRLWTQKFQYCSAQTAHAKARFENWMQSLQQIRQ